MESLEISAKTVEEAVELALERLGASREEVEVAVVKRGRAGFLGIGGEEAVVRVTRRRSEETTRVAVILAKEVLERLISLMRIPATIRVSEPSKSGAITLDISGEELGILIGRRGNTLACLQYLVYLMVSHQMKARVPVSVDVEGYRERRREALRNLAMRMAERVTETGQSVTMEPMPAGERRIIHLALRDYPGVTTQSIGEGEDRKVTIMSKE